MATASPTPRQVTFVVGNTYAKIPDADAELDRSGRFRKTHDWTLYVDVVSGDADVIERVVFDMRSDTFDPRRFECRCPIRAAAGRGGGGGDGDDRSGGGLCGWRFQTRHQTYGAVSPEILIRGRGGTLMRVEHSVGLRAGGSVSARMEFAEARPDKPLRPVAMSGRFGIELELTSAGTDSAREVAASVRSRAAVDVRDLTHDYALASRSPNDVWRLAPDSSIACHRDQPDCNRFELVSPVLEGGDGLSEAHNVLRGLDGVPSIKVNKTMGFHVHIDVEGLSCEQLVKLCQNFIKYEDAMDSIMPRSRRGTDNPYCKSNRLAVGGTSATNKARNDRLGRCDTVDELCRIMNPSDDRYYKLNLQNLRSGRQPTVEFRQHSATSDPDKVKNWVRLCAAMVRNSARLRPPSFLKGSTGMDEQFDMLFEYVIKDRYLRDYYRGRQADLFGSAGDDDGDAWNGHCCEGCASGEQCSLVSQTTRKHRRNR